MGNSAPTHKTIRYPSGNVYEGSTVGSKRHGPGTLKWADGARYEGDWLHDEMSGNGRLAFPNGSVYEGAFTHNNPYGRGTLTTINGEKLTGEWQFQGRGANGGPVGKYFFSGDVFDPSTGKREHYSGMLALHLLSGLVALPGMTDPTAAVMPYAHVVGAGEDRKILHEAVGADGVPQAKVVESAPSGIAYGYQDPALRARHRDDHATVDLMDPRLWLVSVGLNPRSVVGDPHNFNAKRQAEIRAQEARENGAPPASLPVAQAVQRVPGI